MHLTGRGLASGAAARALRARSAPLCLAAGIAAALGSGCTLITDVDRSKIPAAEVVPPDPPPPETDAGDTTPPEADAGPTGDAGDAGDAGGAEPLDAGGDTTEPDAASPPSGDAG